MSEADGEQPVIEGEEVLDPVKSKRQHWREPMTGIMREVWRPGQYQINGSSRRIELTIAGDGDGHMTSDHFDRVGPVAAEDRWRFYQVRTACSYCARQRAPTASTANEAQRSRGDGAKLTSTQLSTGPFKARINEPPKNVILDDRALHEIVTSDIPKAQLSKRWSHDFSGQGHIRHRRPHRGRPAIKDPAVEDEKDKYYSYAPGKSAPYYFIGEKDYVPILYDPLPSQPTASPPPPDPNAKPKQHNQYTPVDQLIRNGAESLSKTRGKYRARINTFLRRSPSPPSVRDRAKLFGGLGVGRGPYPRYGKSQGGEGGREPSFTPSQPDRESLWMQQDEDEDDSGPTSRASGSGLNEATSGALHAHDTGMQFSSPAKRVASPLLHAPRAKVQKQMGYIERLAAGITDEADAEEEEEEADIPPSAGGESSDSAVVQQLQAELTETREIVLRQDEKIQMLRDQVEELQSQLAMERSGQNTDGTNNSAFEIDGLE